MICSNLEKERFTGASARLRMCETRVVTWCAVSGEQRTAQFEQLSQDLILQNHRGAGSGYSSVVLSLPCCRINTRNLLACPPSSFLSWHLHCYCYHTCCCATLSQPPACLLTPTPRHTMEQQAFRELGLQRGASEAEIKAAYRKLALQCHPDR